MGKPKIPERVQAKADAVLERLRNGDAVADLQGKQLQHDRDIFSFAVGRKWRLVVRRTNGEFVSQGVMSHAQYSRERKPGGRR